MRQGEGKWTSADGTTTKTQQWEDGKMINEY